MSYIIDILIFVFLIFGLVKGWQDGVLHGAVDTVAGIVVFIIAYLVKNPLSRLLYMNLPFLKFHGVFAGISSFNILFYDAIAYIICAVVLASVFQIILVVTGIADKLQQITFAHGLPSRLGGAFCCFLEAYIYLFMILFVLSLLPFSTKYVQMSKLSPIIIKQTPILSKSTRLYYSTISEVYDYCYDHQNNHDLADYNTLDILLENEMLSTNDAETLGKAGKITVDDYEVLIKKYGGK